MAAMLWLDVCSAGQWSGWGWSGALLSLGTAGSPGQEHPHELCTWGPSPWKCLWLYAQGPNAKQGKGMGRELHRGTSTWLPSVTALIETCQQLSFASSTFSALLPSPQGMSCHWQQGMVLHPICVWWSSRWNHRILHCGLCFSVLRDQSAHPGNLASIDCLFWGRQKASFSPALITIFLQLCFCLM